MSLIDRVLLSKTLGVTYELGIMVGENIYNETVKIVMKGSEMACVKSIYPIEP